MRTFSWADFASLFAAMQWTVALVCIALAVGAPLGLGLALLRGHRSAPLRWLAAALQQLVQGVPLGLLMFFTSACRCSLASKSPRSRRSAWPSSSTRRPSWARSGTAASRPSSTSNGKPPPAWACRSGISSAT